MKIFLTILFAATLTVSTFGQADTSKYVLTIKQGKYEKTGTQTYLVVPTTLTNNTNDTLKYLSMSCSWQEFYYTDNKKTSVQQIRCTINIPIMLTLLPRKSVDKVIKLVIKPTTDTSKLKFKIGLNLLKLKDNNEIGFFYDKFRNDTLKNNIIWSNAVTQINNQTIYNIKRTFVGIAIVSDGKPMFVWDFPYSKAFYIDGLESWDVKYLNKKIKIEGVLVDYIDGLYSGPVIKNWKILNNK